jgi:pantothenate kinase
LSSFEDPDEAFRRRGAPFTFDVEAFLKLVQDLKHTPVTTEYERETILLAPSFDHAIKDPVQDEIVVSSRTRLVIVEGNYTLLDQNPWNQISQFCAEKYAPSQILCSDGANSNNRWFVDAPVQLVKERVAKRHLAAGIETSFEAALQRTEQNDIPNGEFIRSLLIKPDVVITN